MQEILINNAVHETRVAVLEDGVLEELRIERNADVSLIGNIYLGVVGKVLPGMQSAFVEIGLPRAAFLHVSDMRQAHQENGGTLPIERLLHDGQVVLVQVAKDPIGTKGARLTTEISLAGRLLVYLPYTSHIGVSQKIEDEAERERLKEAVAKLTEEQGIPKGGFIVRTSGEDAKPEDFVNDMKYLEKLWLDIEAKTHIAGAPCLLYSDVSISQRVLRDIVTEQTGKIIVDNPEVFEELQRFGKKFVPEAVELLELYNSDRPLFDQYNLEKEIEASLSRRVDLKSGGYLIIDQTEAMTLGDRIVIMKDGIVQQVGTPQEVFDHPANIFVAGFIGMPQMNMFDAKLVEQSGKYSVELGGVSIILSEEKQAALAKNNVKSQEITLGIRPEHIALAEAGKDAITGKVDVSEMMGSAIHLHVNACGRDTIIIVQTMDLTGGEDLSIGSEISFAFGGNAVHVFNKESGENLEFI